MKSFLLLTLIVISFSRCSPKNKQDGFSYIVKPFYRPPEPFEPPPPPVRHYSQFNFIVDTTDRLYFFQLEPDGFEYCGVGSDEDKAPFIGLKPEDLIEVPMPAAKEFINFNIIGDSDKAKFVRIAALQDTVKSPTLEWLINSFSDTTAATKFVVRRATQEEEVILTFKKQRQIYHADSVQWDSTKTRFTEN